eukprot:1152734-Pyramimonas_sp.AAC.1
MSKGHLQVARLGASKVAASKLQAPNHPSTLDGFVAVAAHFSGFSMVIVSFYARNGVGVRGLDA